MSASSPHRVCRTPGISCEAVPASNVGRRGHEAALSPRNGAAESFASFIPLFCGVEHQSHLSGAHEQRRKRNEVEQKDSDLVDDYSRVVEPIELLTR